VGRAAAIPTGLRASLEDSRAPPWIPAHARTRAPSAGNTSVPYAILTAVKQLAPAGGTGSAQQAPAARPGARLPRAPAKCASRIRARRHPCSCRPRGSAATATCGHAPRRRRLRRCSHYSAITLLSPSHRANLARANWQRELRIFFPLFGPRKRSLYAKRTGSRAARLCLRGGSSEPWGCNVGSD
jgi:hypothetical protein